MIIDHRPISWIKYNEREKLLNIHFRLYLKQVARIFWKAQNDLIEDLQKSLVAHSW